MTNQVYTAGKWPSPKTPNNLPAAFLRFTLHHPSPSTEPVGDPGLYRSGRQWARILHNMQDRKL